MQDLLYKAYCFLIKYFISTFYKELQVHKMSRLRKIKLGGNLGFKVYALLICEGENKN